MGKDSILPYLEFKNKWIILLSLTSNSGAEDFQYLNVEGTNKKLFEKVIKNSVSWSSKQNMMYVVGANRTKDFIKIRNYFKFFHSRCSGKFYLQPNIISVLIFPYSF